MKMIFLLLLLVLIGCKGGSGTNSATGTSKSLYLQSWEESIDRDVYFSDPVGNIQSFNVSISSDGSEAFVVWARKDSITSKTDLYLSHFKNSTWHHPASLTDTLTVTSEAWANLVGVYQSANGDVLISWLSGFDYYTKHYRNGSWGGRNCCIEC